jgi:hypothetical protein
MADSAKTYDYARSVTVEEATAEQTVTSHDAPQLPADELNGFKLNTSEVKKDSINVKGDGTSILNVYYDRIEVTIKFFKITRVWWQVKRELYKTITGLYEQPITDWPDATQVLGESARWKYREGTEEKILTFIGSFILDSYANHEYLELETEKRPFLMLCGITNRM